MTDNKALKNTGPDNFEPEPESVPEWDPEAKPEPKPDPQARNYSFLSACTTDVQWNAMCVCVCVCVWVSVCAVERVVRVCVANPLALDDVPLIHSLRRLRRASLPLQN